MNLSSLATHATDQRIFQANFQTKFEELETRWEDMVERLESRVEDIENEQAKQRDEVVNVKLTLAQKMGPGAIAGLLAAIIVAVVQALWGK